MPTGSADLRGQTVQQAIATAALSLLRRARGPLLGVWALVQRLAAMVMGLPVWIVLGAIIACQWAIVGVVAAINTHNGWVFYNGGDDTWYYTSAWVLGHGHIPDGTIGYGYPFLLVPIARLAGPNLLQGLPFIVGLNVLVLWPVALLCVYGLAKMIAGRGFAYLTSLVWTVLPVAAIPFFYHRYHARYIGAVLPSSLGLTGLADFPGMVALLVAGYFGMKAVTRRQSPDALFAGLAAGLAIAVKPSNAIFLPAPIAALVVARYARGLFELALGLAPMAVTLVLWKYRGLGYLPVLENPPAALALGRFADVPVGGLNLHRYLPLDWGHLQDNINYVREFAWSLRMLTWIIAAGAIGLARRSGAGAVLILVWLASFVLLKGSSPVVSVKAGNFFRYLAPAFPAFFLLGASVPLLVPGAGARLAAAGKAARPWPEKRTAWRRLFGLALVISVLPILALLLFRPLTAPAATRMSNVDQYVPAGTFSLSAKTVRNGTVRLDWPSQQAGSARVSYLVFRTPQDPLVCQLRVHSAALCDFFTDRLRRTITPIAHTRSTSWLDKPPAGAWVYRVALTAATDPHSSSGDFLLVSRPVSITAAG